MSNTPGQESQPKPIDAKALQDQLIEFMLETALRQKRFQNLIGLMEQVTAEARAKKADDWKPAFEQLRKDIAAIQARGPASGPVTAPGASPSPELAEIKTKLSRLEAQMTVLLRALSGGESSPTSGGAGPRPAASAASGAHTAGPRAAAASAPSSTHSSDSRNAMPSQGAPQSEVPSSSGPLSIPASSALSGPGIRNTQPEEDEERRPFWRLGSRSVLLTTVCVAVAGAALATLVMSERLEEPPPPIASPMAPSPAAPSPAAPSPAAPAPAAGAAQPCTSEQVCAPSTAAATPAAAGAAPTAANAPVPPRTSDDAGVPRTEAPPAAESAARASGEQPAWALAWNQALVQPAICPTDPKRLRVPFARCVCGEAGLAAALSATLSADGGAGAPVKGLEAQCPLDEKDPKWNTRLAVTAVQAVLMSAKRLAGKAPARADGDMGDRTVAAVKVLGGCQSLAQTEGRALTVLENRSSGADERGTAALKLLAALKSDPSCLNPDSPGGAAGRSSPRRP